MYEESRFQNGARLLTVQMPHAYSASIGVYLGVGSRYETDHLGGASHFIEHMMFKGTQRRPTAKEIALSIEGIGGVINASTAQEMTTYWAKVGRTHLPIAIDTLLDMVRHSRFDPKEVEKERGVILEELNETMDIPEEIVYRQLQAHLWPNHPLGRDIAGTHPSVGVIDRQSLVDYYTQHYGPTNSVVAVASAWSHDEVRRMVEPHLSSWEQATTTTPFLPAEPLRDQHILITERDIEQGHCCLAVRALHRKHPDRYALHILNAVLGEGMSSRLFLHIRENLGLAYTIYSDVTLLEDTGAFVIYAAVDPENVTAAVRAVQGEWDRLRQEKVGQDELNAAREYVKGRLLLHLEDTAANSSWVGTQAVLGMPILTPENTIASLDAVTTDDVLRVAQSVITGDAIVLSIVGPISPDIAQDDLLTLR